MSSLKKKKVLLFYNPYAGAGLFKNQLDLVISRFQAKRTLLIPIRAGKAEVLDVVFQHMDQREFAQVAIAGGDGTINICVNAMLRNGIDLPISLFPTGTANDFAHYFDLPNDINEMLDIALGSSYTYADVGQVNDKYFLNVAAMGMLVDVSQKTDPNLKSTLGMISYYLKGISEFPSLKPTTVRLASAAHTGEERMYFMLVMNGKSAGGFKRIAPTASVSDGELDVMLFREMPIKDFPALLIKVLQGQHADNKHVLNFKTPELRIESDMMVSTDIDGEKGEAFPLHFKVLHQKLKVLTKYDNMPGAKW